jgi:CheY-like chemotaxis protein
MKDGAQQAFSSLGRRCGTPCAENPLTRHINAIRRLDRVPLACCLTDPYFKETTVIRVLVVEDDPNVCDVLILMLRRAGHRVWSTSNGVDAVILAQQQRPDLILMDLRLPVMDGLEATRQLKADPCTAHIPVLALTADPFAEAQARAAGCDGFIIKPCVLERLLAQVAALAGRDIAGDPGASSAVGGF